MSVVAEVPGRPRLRKREAIKDVLALTLLLMAVGGFALQLAQRAERTTVRGGEQRVAATTAVPAA